MVRILPFLILVACMIYSAVHVAQSDPQKVRGLPKSLWLVLVILVPLLGMAGWWIFGRPIAAQDPPPTAPDDDPDFLRSL